MPGLTDVRIARDPGRPERVMRINRDKIAQLGLSMQQVAEIIETNLAGSRATVLRESGREYDIVVRLAEPDRELLADVDQVSLVSAAGETVPLRNVVEMSATRGPVVIDRKDQERVIPVTATLVAGQDLGRRQRRRGRPCARWRCPAASRSCWAASTRSSRKRRASS